MTENTKIENGTIITFMAQPDGSHVGKIMDVQDDPFQYVVHTKNGDEFFVSPGEVVSIGKPKSARDYRREAVALLVGKSDLTNAEKLERVSQAINALTSAEAMLTETVKAEAAKAAEAVLENQNA